MATAIDRCRLLRADVGPAHAPHHRLAADAEIDDLADQREYRDLGTLAFGVLAGRVLPDLAQALVRRLEHAVVDAVERRGRMGELAQHELHDLAGLRPRHDEGDHALQHHVQCRLRRGGVCRPALSTAKAWLATERIVSTMKSAQAARSPSLPPK